MPSFFIVIPNGSAGIIKFVLPLIEETASKNSYAKNIMQKDKFRKNPHPVT